MKIVLSFAVLFFGLMISVSAPSVEAEQLSVLVKSVGMTPVVVVGITNDQQKEGVTEVYTATFVALRQAGWEEKPETGTLPERIQHVTQCFVNVSGFGDTV